MNWWRYRPARTFSFDQTRAELGAGATIVSPYQGDGMADAIEANRYRRCLEVGLASGSTAIYMLSTGAEVVSIDRAQRTEYGSAGIRTIERERLQDRHRLIEGDSIDAMHQLWRSGERFDFIFFDGWKTFDHLAVEVYYGARLLTVGGMMVFDDAHMPSVKKAARLAAGHYGMERVQIIPRSARVELLAHAAYALARGKMKSAWNALGGHVCALRKTSEIDQLPVANDWNFFVRV